MNPLYSQNNVFEPQMKCLDPQTGFTLPKRLRQSHRMMSFRLTKKCLPQKCVFNLPTDFFKYMETDVVRHVKLRI